MLVYDDIVMLRKHRFMLVKYIEYAFNKSYSESFNINVVAKAIDYHTYHINKLEEKKNE